MSKSNGRAHTEQPQHDLIETADGALLTREQWLLERDRDYGIGASDAAIAAGLSGSPVKLWYKKKGLIRDDFEPTEQMWFGTEMEPVIARRWSIMTGEVLIAKQVFVRHPEYPWLYATLDYLTIDGGIREIKAMGLYGKDEEDKGLAFDPANPPARWIVQAQQQMAVTGEDEVQFPVFYGPELALKQCVVRRDDELWELLFASIQSFRQSLIDDVPPTEFRPDDASILAKVFKGKDGPDLTIDDPRLIKMAAQHVASSATYTESDKAKNTARAALLQAIGNSTTAKIGDYMVARNLDKKGAVRLTVTPPPAPAAEPSAAA
jgi:putative phage-type endonuclease